MFHVKHRMMSQAIPQDSKNMFHVKHPTRPVDSHNVVHASRNNPPVIPRNG